MEAAGRIQGSYQKEVEAGRLPGDAPSPHGAMAVEYMIKSWNVWRHRFEYFDRNFFKPSYNHIIHDKFEISGQEPVLASSSYFYVQYSANQLPISFVLNVVPVSEQNTYVIFSYPKKDKNKIRKFLRPVLEKTGS